MRLLRDKAETLGHAADEEAFRYPGPSPQSRETGLLMIADQLEATARSNPPTDDAQCDGLVRTTMERIQGERQLDDSGLTIGELARAERAFSRALQAMYHRRLSYPSSDDRPRRPRLVFPSRRRTVAS
jgi:membrane-associated HD superfamily phosphohydrolase